VIAGDRYYQRGLDYFKRGHVVSIEVVADTIHAVVRGTEVYSVEIEGKADRLDFQCDCPLGEDGEFCKHCVAAALAWLRRDDHGSEPAAEGKSSRKAQPRTTPRKITTQDIARVLGSTDKATLVELILEWSQDEPGLRAKLDHHTALAMGPEAAVHQARLSLEKAIRIRRFVEYHAAGGYAGAVHSAVDLVEKLLRSGHAAPVIELSEAALRWLAAACGNIDDSAGRMTELMERLQEIHLRACETAKPDPVALAARLFRAELLAEYGEFHDSAERYGHILGPEGTTAFRKLAAAEWAGVPVPDSEASPGLAHSMRREERRNDYRITSIMMSLARQSGDVEQLVSIMERDLSSAYQYLRIAETYQAAGREDKALEWAEKGVAAYPERTDGRLRLFLAGEYQRRDRHQEAIRIAWLEFLDRTGIESYKLLERFARRDDDWKEWRERALRKIRRELAGRNAKRSNAAVFQWPHKSLDRSLLVEVFLYEGKLEDAWREAQDGGCSEFLWLRLAEARSATNPEDAIPIYFRQAEAGIENAPGHRYDNAVKLLERAAELHRRVGRSGAFREHVDALRAKYKAKRNFQKLVEQRRGSLYLE
jgi:tetratricopeptide (TPR) repeat protein